MTDPIADMLTRIRNANQMRNKEVSMPVSKMKVEIAKILDAEGKVYKRIPAGKVPDVIPMRAGTFTLCAHTDNLDTWKEANNGRGEACYYASEEVTIQFGERGYLSMSVPMTNYAVGLELPEDFDNLFASHQLSIVSGDRNVEIQEGENAYFDVADGGFTYALSVTNNDGDRKSVV